MYNLTKITVSFLLGLLTMQTLQAENLYEASLRLESVLLKDYHRQSRPVLNDGDNVTITVGVSLYLIRQLDDKYQIFTTSLWIRQKWYDPRLTWNPSDFASVKSINIRSANVWLPDIKVYNEIDRRVDSGLDQFRTRVIIDYLGKVLWMAPAILRSSCQVDVKLFPFDTQTCKFKIGSWTYDGFSVDVIPENYTLDISKSPSSPEWVLLSTLVEKNIQTYPCCPEPYPDITYTMTIKRREESYWMNFIYPGIFLTAMTMLTFITPASDTGERISLVLTSLVSMFFFLKMIADKTPSSDTIPILSVYFLMLSFEIGLIFYSVCISVNAYHNRALTNMPAQWRSLVLGKLGWIWDMTKDREDIARKINELKNCFPKEDDVTGNGTTNDVIFDTSLGIEQGIVGDCDGNSRDKDMKEQSVSSFVRNKTDETESFSIAADLQKSIIYAGNNFIWMTYARNKHPIDKNILDNDTWGNNTWGVKIGLETTRDKDTADRNIQSEISPDNTGNKDSKNVQNKDLRNRATRVQAFDIPDEDIKAETSGDKDPRNKDNKNFRGKDTPQIHPRNQTTHLQALDVSTETFTCNEVTWNKDTHGENSRDKAPRNKAHRNKQPRNKETTNKDHMKKVPANKDPTNKAVCLAVDQPSGPSTRNNEVEKNDNDASCSCPMLLDKMVEANGRLLDNLYEIRVVARRFDKKSAAKERWLLAASILDRAFLVLFVFIFVSLSLANFIG